MTERAPPSRRGDGPRAGDAASLADILGPVRSVLPEALIDDRGWERLLVRAERLPAAAADAMFGFECRLDLAEASADLLLSVPPDTPFAAALVRHGASGGAKAAALARFLSAMRQGSPLADAVDLVALEYDTDGDGSLPAPGIFLRSGAGSGHADADRLTAAIALAAGWSETPAERNGVARVLAALPPGAAIRWAGGFPDRRRRAVRLLVRGLGEGSAAFLSRIGWSGDASVVDGAVSSFRACGVDNHVLALDVAEGQVSPGIALEFSRPGLGGGWGAALDMMARERLCLPRKAAALARATRSERIFSQAGMSELHCGVHHVKVALPRPGSGDPGARAPAAAKGYVACLLRPLS